MNPVRSKQLRTLVWTAASVFFTIVALLLLSTIDNPDGTPWLESSLVGQTLVVVGSLSAIVLPSLLGARKDAAVARDQLENSHVADTSKVSNVRDDLDIKHNIMFDAVQALAEKMEHKFDGVYAEFRGARKDIGRAVDQADRAATSAERLRDRLDEYRDGTDKRLDHIEGTLEGIATVTGSIPVAQRHEEDRHE